MNCPGDTPAEEIIEEWDWSNARPTGRQVSRKEAHMRGIPHEGVHLWIITTERKIPEILFQHRAPHKEQYPNCLDITVGGHVPFGLATGKIQKESQEEIGISPHDSELVDLGLFRYEEISSNLFHREFQQVYLLFNNRPLDEYRFNDREVAGIYAIPLKEFEEIFVRDREIQSRGFNGKNIIAMTTKKDGFHPQLFDRSMKEYMNTLFKAIHEYLECGAVHTRMILKHIAS